jgi:hypothetical protein
MQVMEVEAFCSVHDMIHAAIYSYGTQASLREVRPPRLPGRLQGHWWVASGA